MERIDHLEKMAEEMFKGIARLRESQDITDAQIRELRESQKKTDEQINKTDAQLNKTIKKLYEIGRQLGDLGFVQDEGGAALRNREGFEPRKFN